MSADSQPAVERPAMASNPQFIFFTDFDGTITLEDTNDYMTDHLGYGGARRRAGNADVLDGRRTFRDAFQEMLDSVQTTSFADCIALLTDKIQLDPHFAAFFAWAEQHNVPIVVLSGGMAPVIRALLGHWLGADAVARRLQIVSNDVALRTVNGGDEVVRDVAPGTADYRRLYEEPGAWRLVYHDDSPFGHDKSLEIRKYARMGAGRPTLFYAGDGVSDLSAAHECDLMFAKAGRDLVTYCRRESVPYAEFGDFGDIAAMVEDVVEGRRTIAEVIGGGKSK